MRHDPRRPELRSGEEGGSRSLRSGVRLVLHPGSSAARVEAVESARRGARRAPASVEAHPRLAMANNRTPRTHAWLLLGPVLLGIVTLGLGVAVLCAPLARAEDEELRARYVAGSEEVRASILKALEGRPAQVGSLLGPVLRDRALRAPGGQAAAWLLDQAKDGKGGTLLLEEEILLRARDDAAFVEEMRGRLSPTGPGLSTLAAAARRHLDDPKDGADLRTACAWTLRYDTSVASARALAEAWAAGTPEVSDVAQASLGALLSYRFETPALARKFIAEHDKQSFVEWLRELSAQKDRPDALIYRRLVAEARANIERAKTFEDLYGYFDRAQNPWPEVRRLAARKATKVAGSDEAWIAVLQDAVEGETDREALVALLDVAARLRGGADEGTYRLAKAATERLGACCNDPELQKGLLAALAQVGTGDDLKAAYESLKRKDVSESGVLEAWLAAAGAVGGNELELCEFHRQRLPKTEALVVRLRIRALEALARGAAAPGASWSNVVVAATYLRGILRRDDLRPEERSLPRELDPEVRMAAVRSLEGFSSPETAARLHALVEVPPETPELARLAVSVLGKLAARNLDAAQALIDIAHSRANPEARIEAVRDLVRIVPDADPDMRRAVEKVLQDTLRADAGPLELRIAAAESVAAVAEAGVFDNEGALPGVLALWLESSRRPGPPLVADPVPGAAERLVRALVTSGERHDADVISGIARLGGDGALEPAIRLADAAADAGAGRTGLQALRAGLYLRRSRLPDREAAARRADLVEAQKILRSVMPSSDATDPKAAALAPTLALYQDVVLALLADPEVKNGQRRSALLAAIDLVARRHDVDRLAQAKTLLVEARVLPDLTDEEKSLLNRAAIEFDRLGAPAPK